MGSVRVNPPVNCQLTILLSSTSSPVINMAGREFFTAFVIFTCFLGVLGMECPSSCPLCSPERVTCYLKSCKDLVFLGETDLLIVEGPMCQSHRVLLRDVGKYHKLQLSSSSCQDLSRCRYGNFPFLLLDYQFAFCCS